MIRLKAICKKLTIHFFVICCANMPFWIMGELVFMNRALFNYDTIIALIISILSKTAGVFFLLLAWLADGLISQSLTYQFTSPIDFLQSARFSENINWYQLITYWHLLWLVICIFFLWLLLTIFKHGKVKLTSVVSLSSLCLLIVLCDAVNGTSDIWRRDKMIMPINIAGSPGFSLIKNSLMYPEKQGLRPISYGKSISSNFDLVSWASAHPDRSILFVMVESLGIPKSDDAMEFFQKSLSIKNYKKYFYQIDFRGATTSGELRELCGLEGSYKFVNSVIADDCLPQQLSRLGWQTSGFHGFSNQFFDRKFWWPKIGINHIFFIENEEIKNLSRCGNIFRGACDKDLMGVAVSSIATPKSFAYVLTLNTHLPVAPSELPNTLFNMCRSQNISDIACMHIAALKKVLGDIVLSTSSLSVQPLIVIVGDHAPPFFNIKERNAFRQDVVPGVVLVPHIQ